MIYRIPAGEDDGRIFADIYSLLAEVLAAEALDPDERVKIKTYSVLFCQVKVWRSFSFRTGLSYQDTFHLHLLFLNTLLL